MNVFYNSEMEFRTEMKKEGFKIVNIGNSINSKYYSALIKKGDFVKACLIVK